MNGDEVVVDDAPLNEEEERPVLTDEPPIPVPTNTLRKIGSDADPISTEATLTGASIQFEEVPEFFQALGVPEAKNVELDALTGGVLETIDLLEDQEDGSQERRLRAVDFILTQERLGTASEWSVGGAEGGVSIASYDVIYTNTDFRRLPYIKRVTRYVPPPPQPPPTAQQRLSGLPPSEEIPKDTRVISTMYLLSPPGTPKGADPDSSWSAYASHQLFYNLNHATNLLPVASRPNPITFPVAGLLAGGVAVGVVNNILAELNDRFDSILEFLNNREIKGTWWTI